MMVLLFVVVVVVVCESGERRFYPHLPLLPWRHDDARFFVRKRKEKERERENARVLVMTKMQELSRSKARRMTRATSLSI